MRLRNKFLALLLPAGALTALLILFLTRRSVHAVIVDQLVKSSTLLAEAAAPEAAPGFESRSEALLLPVLQSIQKREGALYAAALGPQGRILAHTSITEKGKAAEGPLSDAPAVRMTDFRDEPALEVSVPVWSAQAEPAPGGLGFLMSGESAPGSRRRLGFLRVGLPLQPALRTEERILRGVVLIVGAIGAAALLLVLVLVGGILRPINGLMEGIERIRRGRYDVEVPPLSNDELGDLARSFNVMCHELVRSTVSKEYVESVIENIGDPVLVAGAAGAIETVNRAALETFGRFGTDLIGRPLSDLFDGDAEAVRREIEDSLAAGPIRDREVALKTRDGRVIPAIFSASALTDLRGRRQGCVCIAKDITERKRAEEELRAAKTAAEAVSRELEAFSYSVSHDLRAPLRGIAGFSQIVLEDAGAALDASSRECLVRVVDGTKLMGRLIDDILELSRVSRTEMTRRTVDLSEIARDVAAGLRQASPSRRADVLVADGLVAEGDPNLLRIALSNLIGNAWKYSAKKEHARIEVGSFLDAAGARTFFVKDDGAGFDMAYSDKLFGAFQRLHAQAEFDGTGVGLATVQRIIRRHGGKIWAEGYVGKGATFYFTL